MANAGIVEALELGDEAKAQIRHRCGYGCIRCGVTVYLYAQFPLDDFPGEDPSSSGLLCPTCFSVLQNNPLSHEHYAALLERPVARDPNFDRSRLPYGGGLPQIVVGGPAAIRGTSIPVMISGHAPIAFVPTMTGIGATRIDVRLAGADGHQHQVVRANLWCARDGGWTFEHRRGRYIIASEICDSRAEFEFVAPDRVTILNFITSIDGQKVVMTPHWLEIDGMRFTNVIASNQLIGFSL